MNLSSDYIIALLLITVSGSIGGISYAVVTHRSNRFRLPFSGRLIELGCLGDVIVGISASVSVYFLLGSLFNLRISEMTGVDGYVKLFAIGVIAGFAGMRLLSGMSSTVMVRMTGIEERLDKVEIEGAAAEYVRLGDFLLDRNPERALIVYNKALRLDADNKPALIGMAKAHRRREMWDEAIEVLDGIITDDPDAERAYYNRACYKQLSGMYPSEDVLMDLKQAISLFSPYRQYAQEDEDFRDISENPQFLALCQE